jgi:hypothetical protein
MVNRVRIPIYIFNKPNATGHKCKGSMKRILQEEYKEYLKWGRESASISRNVGNILTFSVGKKWVHYKIGFLPIGMMPEHETNRKVLISEIEENAYFPLLKRPEFIFRISNVVMLDDRVEMEVVPEYSKDFLEMEKARLASYFHEFIWRSLIEKVMHPSRLWIIAEKYDFYMLSYCDVMGW